MTEIVMRAALPARIPRRRNVFVALYLPVAGSISALFGLAAGGIAIEDCFFSGAEEHDFFENLFISTAVSAIPRDAVALV